MSYEIFFLSYWILNTIALGVFVIKIGLTKSNLAGLVRGGISSAPSGRKVWTPYLLLAIAKLRVA